MRSTLQPLSKKHFVTYHNAFPYLVRRYDLALDGVIEVSSSVEPSPGYLVKLLRRLRLQPIQVIFTERQSHSRLSVQLARDLGVPYAPLDTLETGSLIPEAYEQGMRDNLETLKRYLE